MDYPILNGLPEDVRRRVMSAARLRRFARGEVVFHEGDPGDTFHLIAKGRVAVRLSTALGDATTLAILGRGNFFGELALLEPILRTATVVALEETETHAIRRDEFDRIREEHPSVQAFLVLVLGEQVRRLSRQVIEALHVPADRRVLRRLDELAELYGANDEPETVIPLTQEDLASMAGTSRATVNRVLGGAEKEGVVVVGRRKVTVVDRDSLARRAGRRDG